MCLDEALVFESLQERVQRPAFDAGEAVQPKNLGDREAVTFSLAEHRERWMHAEAPRRSVYLDS
jgi:hypothetical protein